MPLPILPAFLIMGKLKTSVGFSSLPEHLSVQQGGIYPSLPVLCLTVLRPLSLSSGNGTGDTAMSDAVQ
jgi:hypothetical protein